MPGPHPALLLPSQFVAAAVRQARRFAILGIHGPEVRQVDGDVARVRLFLASGTGESRVVDEDFQLPVLPAGVSPSEMVYESLLEPVILARIAVLEAQQ